MYWGMKPEIAGAVKRVPAGRILCRDRGGDGEERTAAGSASGREARKRREEAVRQAADGIRMKGEPEPVLVRRLLPSDGQPGSGDFDCVLVAGEIRVEAAELAGLGEIPCVYVDSAPDGGSEGSGNGLDGAAQAIVETVRREEIGLFECAAAIAALVERTGCTQEACAAMLGVSQSFVANKLRLLRLTAQERRLMLEGGLAERHGRALLRFPDPADRLPVLRAMIGREMNVASAEEYVESLLRADARAEARARRSASSGTRPADPADLKRLALRDTRRFAESIDRAVDVIRRSGIPVEMGRKDTPAGTVISILVPKSS
ncbi:MAG: hypothetical protein II953_06160 [Clostridia bacterium]|nr:hypothetical protein [Clostridia bacterium]